MFRRSSRGAQRFDLLLEQGETFAPIFELSRSGPWTEFISSAIGKDWICDISVIYSRPGADDQDWHSDGPHLIVSSQKNLPSSASSPYAFCVFLALIDLDELVGFTQFWPGSHREAGLAGFGSAAPVLGCAVDGIVGAGGAVVYDYRLLHRGMANKSQGTQREILQFFYHVPEYVERKNYGCTALF
uniref:Phytanoyl-CoA dioxygenase n=1 Tax=Guillardia theta (strain CCMP2712) TaxID=905079 RepID=A0A0C3SK82_GUITC